MPESHPDDRIMLIPIHLVILLFMSSLMPATSQTPYACDLELQIQSGNVSFNESLRGITLQISMGYGGLPWSVYDADTNTFTGGYCVDIFDALSAEAGFAVNYSLFAPENGETYTQALARVLQTSDAAGTWYTDAADRRVLGMNFAHHFIDATVVLLIPKPEYQQETFSMTAFLKPFTAELWIVLVAGIVFNAICGFLFHLMETPSAQLQISKDLMYDFGSYVYASFGHFTAAGDGFEPKSIWSRINTLLWSFLVVIVLASYTANLATALIAEVSFSDSLDTIDAIVSEGKAICLLEAGLAAGRIKDKWPHIKVVDTSPDSSGAFMRNGTCAGALMGYTDATVVLAESCDMQLTTTRIFPSGGSFVFQTDENRCGPTLLKLLDYHLVRLDENGVLEELWDKQIESFKCEFSADDAVEGEDEFFKLGLNDLGGLCTIYAICAVVLLIGSLIGYCYRTKKMNETKEIQNKREMTNTINTNELINETTQIAGSMDD